MPLKAFEEDEIFMQYEKSLSTSYSGHIDAAELDLLELYGAYGIEALTDSLNKIPKSGNAIDFSYSGILSLPDKDLAGFLALIPPWVSMIDFGIGQISEEKRDAVLNEYLDIISKNTDDLDQADYNAIFEEKEPSILNKIKKFSETLEEIKNNDIIAYNEFLDLLKNIIQQFSLVKANPALFFRKEFQDIKFETTEIRSAYSMDSKKLSLNQNKFAIFLNLLEELTIKIKEWKTKQQVLKDQHEELETHQFEQDNIPIEIETLPTAVEIHEEIETLPTTVEIHEEIPTPVAEKEPETKAIEQPSVQEADQKQTQGNEKNPSTQNLWLRIFKPKVNEGEGVDEETLLNNRFTFANEKNSSNRVGFGFYERHFEVMEYDPKKTSSYLWTSGLSDCVAIGLIIHSKNNEPKKAMLYHSVSEHNARKSINTILDDYVNHKSYKDKYRFIYAVYDFLTTIEEDDEIEAVIYSNTPRMKDLSHPDVVLTKEIIEGCLSYLGKKNVKINTHPISGDSPGFFLTPTGIAGLII